MNSQFLFIKGSLQLPYLLEEDRNFKVKNGPGYSQQALLSNMPCHFLENKRTERKCSLPGVSHYTIVKKTQTLLFPWKSHLKGGNKSKMACTSQRSWSLIIVWTQLWGISLPCISVGQGSYGFTYRTDSLLCRCQGLFLRRKSSSPL